MPALGFVPRTPSPFQEPTGSENPWPTWVYRGSHALRDRDVSVERPQSAEHADLQYELRYKKRKSL
ncbi:hypothetical protein L915_18187 [Phytophthora nicotianae]|uniref:Uncharacterized protein n=1 Tax=Phytophthora nicotianae TaxID=4792 RepID=W2MFB1_PHYNI|nr:hypothetical protein L915_18187 [Phytophthora nicotianae]ETM35046.1 hypothetical protein L914_17994 [Phytophthora nicotianae]